MRGELYFFVDSLICNPHQVETQKVLEFFLKVFEFFNMWLKLFNSHYLQHFDACLQNPHLVYTSRDCGISFCGYELFDMVKSMLGLDARTRDNLRNIEKFLTEQYVSPKYFESEDP